MLVRLSNQGQAPDLATMNRELEDIVQEVNRQADQLDSFNKGLVIVAKGTTTFSWDGTVAGGNANANSQVAHTLGYSPMFLAFYKWSGDSGTPWRPLNDLRYDSTGTVTWQIEADCTDLDFQVGLTVAQAGSSSSFTVAYFLLKDPLQIQ